MRRATTVIENAPEGDSVELDYESRFLRRRKLTSTGGEAFLVDLPETVSLDEGQGFRLDDGTVIAIRAADEPLYEVRGENLARLAWHIGNRHTPARIEAERILIRADRVLKTMLEGLGAKVVELTAPFRPEGGAYGTGRTLGHSHGPTESGDAHSND